MHSPTNILDIGKQIMPELTFRASHSFYWSPRTKTVFYSQPQLKTDSGKLALLHEIAHAQLRHSHYNLDIELLQFEVAAWEAATTLAKQYSVPLDPGHAEDCLDTYRDWLYARSTCPACKVNAPQIDRSTYKCINCSTLWSVSLSRFCRPYRMQSRQQKTPSGQSQTVFQ